MNNSKWRMAARRAIELCLVECAPLSTAQEFRKAVFDYYPFGERAYHPYKIWLDEVKRTAERIEHTPTPDHIRNYWTKP